MQPACDRIPDQKFSLPFLASEWVEVVDAGAAASRSLAQKVSTGGLISGEDRP